MTQDRTDDQQTASNARNEGNATTGGDVKSASQREDGSDAASRYQAQMQDLDSAGAIDQPHDRKAAGSNSDSAADKGSASDDDGSSESGRTGRSKLRDNAAMIGLAASTLALVAAGSTRGGGAGAGAEAPEELAAKAGFMPPAEVSEKKGVTWDLHVSDHERVDFFTEFLMGKNYDKTRTWIERIGKYGPMIQNELRERGMPEDLLYLTMIESGLDPNAYSKADAAGLWQFIEETGERYGLEVSEYLDERRDPVEATGAALTYLQEMHERFDSWYLSSAGYNTGENRVGRLMRETTGSEKGSDEGYWEIWERLPSETRDYVPLMLSMGHIAKEPAKYGFHDIEYEAPLRFQEVIVPGGTKLSDVAKSAGVDVAVIEDLNPHYVKKMTPPDREMGVRVPVGHGPQVATAFGGQMIDTGFYGE